MKNLFRVLALALTALVPMAKADTNYFDNVRTLSINLGGTVVTNWSQFEPQGTAASSIAAFATNNPLFLTGISVTNSINLNGQTIQALISSIAASNTVAFAASNPLFSQGLRGWASAPR